MRKTRKLLSIILSAAMVATAIPATSLAGQSGSIDGDGEFVGDLVYSIVVPTDLAFTVNPLGFDYPVGGGTSNDSIISPGYGFLNKSSVPVELDVNFQFVTPEGISIAALASDIQDSSDEEPTIFMDVEPCTTEPTFVSTASVQYVTFAGLSFVSGPAVLTSSQAIRFKMNSANYTLDSSKNTVYVDNDKSGDTVGFRFGGKASMFSDWKGKSISVTATYGINAISKDDYDAAGNVTGGQGFNRLNQKIVDVKYDEVDEGPEFILNTDGTMRITEAEGATLGGLFYIVDADKSISVSKSQIKSAVKAHGLNTTVGEYTIVDMVDVQDFTWDNSTMTGELSAGAKGFVHDKHFLVLTTVTKDGVTSVAVSDQYLMP